MCPVQQRIYAMTEERAARHRAQRGGQNYQICLNPVGDLKDRLDGTVSHPDMGSDASTI